MGCCLAQAGTESIEIGLLADLSPEKFTWPKMVPAWTSAFGMGAGFREGATVVSGAAPQPVRTTSPANPIQELRILPSLYPAKIPK